MAPAAVMTRVLVTGATGLVGHFLLPRLQAAGMTVHALSRRPQSAADLCWYAGDLSASSDWVRRLPEMDLCIHAAPLWLLPPLLPQLRSLGVSRLIAFGSTSRFTKTDSASPRERSVAQALATAEAQLAEQGEWLNWTVFRPTLIYGAGRDRNVSAIAGFIRRFGFFPVAGAAVGKRQPVHGADLADACLAALDAAATRDRAFNLGGGEELPYRQMVLRVFEALGRRPRIVPVPEPALRAATAVAARLPGLGSVDPAMVDRMKRDMVFPLADARAAFGYAPRPFRPTLADLGGGA
jgi:nucleoside-diphosphate-sugar epimerase